jgi:hypothetical protein
MARMLLLLRRMPMMSMNTSWEIIRYHLPWVRRRYYAFNPQVVHFSFLELAHYFMPIDERLIDAEHTFRGGDVIIINNLDL